MVSSLSLSACQTPPHAPVHIAGIAWQPDNATANPKGTWDRLGAHTLLVQWTTVSGSAFIAGCGGAPVPVLPDWQRIAQEPWAQDVILGLAGKFDEAEARNSLDSLIAQSRCLAAQPTPLHVVGWYFPVEVDPTWQDASKLGPLLAQLPRPLWISAYDSANLGPAELGNFLATWLPADVGVFFQDGVGVYAREPRVALDYVNALEKRLGKARLRLIAEAFRPQIGGGFRAATPAELTAQLANYGGRDVYLFDGPHYVSDETVEVLRASLQLP
ncbi:hypothetical protein [Andreprevotia chitinilytica]|uniref:hypothetical protein n=1 Tax=Andreprevotia chitinilytica TaxID=396808 RepID=UPI00068CA09A|nr:hypothetical protein [Andreprevotia chitinilytica]